MKDFSPASILRELIRIPSVSSMSNRPIIEFVRAMLQPVGWRFLELPYFDADGIEKLNLIATPPGHTPESLSVDLAFVCHTDTVPYDRAWRNATDPRANGGRIHGCGACDVKGFLAALLSALVVAPAQEFASTVALVLTAEEEIGCLGAKRLVDASPLRARHVVVGEPTSLHPARAGKGYGLAEIRVSGNEAHSAHPAMGVSAIYGAARLIRRIEQFSFALRDAAVAGSAKIFDPPHTTLNVGVIEGGTAKNVVAGECRFLLEWRPVPGEPSSSVLEAVHRMVEDLRREDPGFGCEIEILREQAGFLTPAESPLVRRWVQITGQSPIAVPFSTEAPLMAALSGDVIVLGPGDMRSAHSSRECVSIDELDRCAACLLELLLHPIEPAL